MKKIFTFLAVSLFTTGASAQWDTLTTNTHTNFNSIAFSSDNNGVAVGYDTIALEGRIYHTTDGGQSWALAHTGTSAKNDVCFSNAMIAWAVGDGGIIKKSTDAGSFWSLSYLGNIDLLSVYFLSETTGFIGGEEGRLYRTMNSGGTWDTLSIAGSVQPVRDIYFADALRGWVVCDGGFVANTIDGGDTWTPQDAGHFGFFQCKGIAFAGTANAFIVGDDGKMSNSADAGLSWNVFSPLTNQDLNSIRFANSLAGITCGANGTIYRTYVGGTNWANESMSYVTEDLTKVCFSSDSVAFICGHNGKILKTNIDISSVQSPVNVALNASAYPNPFESELHLQLNLQQASDVQISIVDLSGRIVLNENFAALSAGENFISPNGITALASGMYMLQVITSYGSVAVPVVKQ